MHQIESAERSVQRDIVERQGRIGGRFFELNAALVGLRSSESQRETSISAMESFMTPIVWSDSRSFTMILSAAAGSKTNQENRNSSLVKSIMLLKGMVVEEHAVC